MIDFAIAQRLGRVLILARDVWKTESAANDFLTRPHPLLSGRTPNEMILESEAGANRVEDILGRLKYGTAV